MLIPKITHSLLLFCTFISMSATAFELKIETHAPIATVDDRFLSFTIDAAQLVGGKWWSKNGTAIIKPYDFGRPKLEGLTRALSPAYFRIGGTESDRVYYDLNPLESHGPVADTLTRSEWDAAMDFSKRLDLKVLFTLNAGPSSRDWFGNWEHENAAALIHYSTLRKDPVVVWELGNELNAFPIFYGLFHAVSPQTYVKDATTLREILNRESPTAKIAGPSPVYWPIWGEPLLTLPRVLDQDREHKIDIVTWHYYPQQAMRCGFVNRVAYLKRLLDPTQLDEIDRWANEVEGKVSSLGLTTPVWLDETGNSQCGGAPGISDRYVSTLWWTDQLGKMAHHGEPVTFRQTLSGSEYGLIDDDTLEPRPDYWVSILWKKIMGVKVLDTQVIQAQGSVLLRAYAHCSPTGNGSMSIAFINLDEKNKAQVKLNQFSHGKILTYALTGEALDSSTVSINDTPMTIDEQGGFDFPEANLNTGSEVQIAPLSTLWVVLPNANVEACH